MTIIPLFDSIVYLVFALLWAFVVFNTVRYALQLFAKTMASAGKLIGRKA
jgi:hypothetical protein